MSKSFGTVGSAFLLLSIVTLTDDCPAQGGVTWHLEHLSGPAAGAMAYDGARQRIVLFGSGETWESDGVDWTQRLPITSPQGGGAMAYDAARRRVVLFDGSGMSSDTWEWDGVNWTQMTTTPSPAVRSGHALAYDVARQRTVLFGGWDGASVLQDTWEWDGATWTQRTPAQSPSACTGHAMAYDAVRQRVVMFGSGETWEWDGVNWMQATPSQSPASRSGHAMAYDWARQRTVLFGGGFDISGSPFADTWEWDGLNWTQVTTTQAPSPRSGHGMVYDASRQRVMLFGGELYHHFFGLHIMFGDMWGWDGRAWVQSAPTQSPFARTGHAMTYDAARQRVVLFGGGSFGAGSGQDTWLWDGVNWTLAASAQSPPAQSGHAMAHDAARQRTVLFGSGETWEWDGVSWTQATPAQSPSARLGHAMAYDAAKQRVVLFGGLEGSNSLSDIWEWDGVNWTQVTATPSPAARSGHALAYDAARQRTVLFGGRDSSWNEFSDTWEWDGAWTQVTSTLSPYSRVNHAMTFDAARHRIVLFGGNQRSGGPAELADTWEWDGVNWTETTPVESPSSRHGHAMAYDEARRSVVLVAGALSDPFSSVLRDTWECSSVSPASFTTFGTGCPGSTGTPTLDTAPFSSPWTGDTFSVELNNLPPGAMTFMVTGLSNTFWTGALIPLPAPLMSWGMPGCTVHTDVVNSELLANTAGTATWTKTIPNDPLLVGLTFYNQGFIIDPGVNAMGATVSNASASTIGMR